MEQKKTQGMKKDAYYFKHDSNARNDEKLLAIRMNHGMEGYGVYWAIVEKLRESKNYTLSTDYPSIAWELHVCDEVVKSIVENYDLFIIEDSKFRSLRLCEDMKEWDDKKEARRLAGIKGMQSRWGQRENKPQQYAQTEIITLTPTPNATSPQKATKTRSKKYSPEETKLHNECKDAFKEIYYKYKGVEYYWKATDASANIGVINQIRYQMKEEERDNLGIVAINYRAFMEAIFSKCSDWYRANSTPAVVNSKFNEIYSQLKNGTNNGNKQLTGDGCARNDADYLTSIIADLQPGSNQ